MTGEVLLLVGSGVKSVVGFRRRCALPALMRTERVAIVNLGFVAFHRLLRSGDHRRSDRMGQTVVSLRAFLQFPPVHYAHDVLLSEHVS